MRVILLPIIQFPKDRLLHFRTPLSHTHLPPLSPPLSLPTSLSLTPPSPSTHALRRVAARLVQGLFSVYLEDDRNHELLSPAVASAVFARSRGLRRALWGALGGTGAELDPSLHGWVAYLSHVLRLCVRGEEG